MQVNKANVALQGHRAAAASSCATAAAETHPAYQRVVHTMARWPNEPRRQGACGGWPPGAPSDVCTRSAAHTWCVTCEAARSCRPRAPDVHAHAGSSPRTLLVPFLRLGDTWAAHTAHTAHGTQHTSRSCAATADGCCGRGRQPHCSMTLVTHSFAAQVNTRLAACCDTATAQLRWPRKAASKAVACLARTSPNTHHGPGTLGEGTCPNGCAGLWTRQFCGG